MIGRTRFVLALSLVAFALGAMPKAQLFSLNREQMIEWSAQNPYERFPDGRPKVPDWLVERARGLSAEEVLAVLPGKNFRNQFANGFQVLHPGRKLVGRAFTVQFMPVRPDLDAIVNANAKALGVGRMNNQVAIDMLQPGDVLVVDLFGMDENGTIVGDNLFYYVMKATGGAGLVVDGAIRDLEGIRTMDMPAYFRTAHPTPIGNVMLTGINVPVRIGKTTVMPGDLVFGDAEGVYFIPPALVEPVLDGADVIHVHDEWTRKKFDEGRYRSREIYGTPSDPALKAEYDAYLKKRLEEIRATYPKK
ncbi:MAG: dimethylmenaquinone methyltransferase [Acidobacteria bacterium]|nr:dimethylmenaquinone methyltransferase [Acidobacteriota bacterium]